MNQLIDMHVLSGCVLRVMAILQEWTASKAVSKQDLFTQGIIISGKRKILTSAETFYDVLFQAWSAEELENTTTWNFTYGNAIVSTKRASRLPDWDSGPQTTHKSSWSHSQRDLFLVWEI